MIGPKSRPTRSVPTRCATNSRVRITAPSGRMTSPSSGRTTSTPSTADSTEMAGVISESP